MDASELILNLVQKAAIKTAVKEKNLSNCELFSNREDSSSSGQHVMKKNSFSCGVSEKSCGDCKKEKPDEGMFKVSLTTNDEDLENDKENVSRKKIRVEARQICSNREKSDEEKMFVLQQLGRSQIRPEGFPAFLCIDGRIAGSNGVKRKIPRPANAFMLFANEWRKKLAAENPRESNKDISVRLGILWKNMAKDVKEKYFALAREVDAEHKRKYPESKFNVEISGTRTGDQIKEKRVSGVLSKGSGNDNQLQLENAEGVQRRLNSPLNGSRAIDGGPTRSEQAEWSIKITGKCRYVLRERPRTRASGLACICATASYA